MNFKSKITLPGDNSLPTLLVLRVSPLIVKLNRSYDVSKTVCTLYCFKTFLDSPCRALTKIRKWCSAAISGLGQHNPLLPALARLKRVYTALWTIIYFQPFISFSMSKRQDLVATLSLFPWLMVRQATLLSPTSSDLPSQLVLTIKGKRVETSSFPSYFIGRNELPLSLLPENSNIGEQFPRRILPRLLKYYYQLWTTLNVLIICADFLILHVYKNLIQ